MEIKFKRSEWKREAFEYMFPHTFLDRLDELFKETVVDSEADTITYTYTSGKGWTEQIDDESITPFYPVTYYSQEDYKILDMQKLLYIEELEPYITSSIIPIIKSGEPVVELTNKLLNGTTLNCTMNAGKGVTIITDLLKLLPSIIMDTVGHVTIVVNTIYSDKITVLVKGDTTKCYYKVVIQILVQKAPEPEDGK